MICVFGVDSCLDPDMRPLLGRTAERAANRTVITSDNPRHERPLDIVHDVLDGYERPARAQIIPDRRKAIQWALAEARPGDSVLIAGKGDEAYQIVGGVQLPHDDRDIARHWLYEVGASEADSTTDRPRLRVVRHIA